MNRRLFEDLVVSTRATPATRRAAVLPFSIALHGGALVLALLVPVLRPGEAPVPASLRPIWEVPRVAPPPAIRNVTPVRVARIPAARAAAPEVREVTPPPAPGPPVLAAEPDSLPVDGTRVPCFVNCGGPEDGGGTGDGPRDGVPNATGEDLGGGPYEIRPGGKIKPPVRTVYVAPAYPGITHAAGLSAVVVLECTIDASGHVADVRIVRGHPLFDESALSAVRQWRYTPTLLNGVPVPVLMTVTVRFTARR